MRQNLVLILFGLAAIGLGVYEFYEPLILGTWDEAKQEMAGGVLQTGAGMLGLLSVLCGQGEADVLRLMAERKEEAAHLLRMVLADSVTGWGGPAPNGPTARPAGG